ncbi:hypothetical protein [Rathayibacter sp. SD072]|uniref:hypothetical protein n=1 Tax=Rathayibacter sp. SD072 TaxID=2781731 RepID=UPI001A9704BD|nr:hypothetical protein [Rathayibacter sp. SD072]MBO0985189.1 hypothetical protein [Rathayibacter sp. SD072]
MPIAAAPVATAPASTAPVAAARPAPTAESVARFPTAVTPTDSRHRLRRIATAPLRGALSVVFITTVVAGSVLQGVGYLSNVGLRALDEPHSL